MQNFWKVAVAIVVFWSVPASAHEVSIDRAVYALHAKLIDALAAGDFDTYSDIYLRSNEAFLDAEAQTELRQRVTNTSKDLFGELGAARYRSEYDSVACGETVAVLTELTVFGDFFVLVSHVFARMDNVWRVMARTVSGNTDLTVAQARHREFGAGKC